MVDRVLEEHAGPVAQYLAGKESIIGFLIGQVMRASQGKADPQLVRQVLSERLEAKRSS
jgi:aspartyl-tRNA(Asn)/glutamyl-tRNA(Gln) amidotransferase subunit B